MALLGCFSKPRETGDAISMGPSIVEDLYLRTVNPIHVIEFVWCIHNFSKSPENIYTEEFAMSDKCSPRWTCALISSTSRANKRDLDLELRRMDKDMPLKIQSKFEMLSRSGELIGETTSDMVLSPFSDTFIVLSAQHPLESTKKKRKIHLPEDKLIISGQLKVSGCCIITKAFVEPTVIVQSVEEKFRCVLHSSSDGSELVSSCSVENICNKNKNQNQNLVVAERDCCTSFFCR